MTDQDKPLTDEEIETLQKCSDGTGRWEPAWSSVERNRVLRDLRRARELLRKVQWYQYASYDESWAECVCCGERQDREHDEKYEYLPGRCGPVCDLAAFLGPGGSDVG